MDQDSAFMSTLMNYLFKRLNMKIKKVAPYNHQCLQAEHGIKLLSTILTKHLTEQGQIWSTFLPLVTLAYNTFNSSNIGNYSPYKLVFGRKSKILLDLETDPDIKDQDHTKAPNIGNYSPYKLVFGRKSKILLDLETDPDIKDQDHTKAPNIGNYSPYKLVFGRKSKILLDLETDPDIKNQDHTKIITLY